MHYSMCVLKWFIYISIVVNPGLCMVLCLLFYKGEGSIANTTDLPYTFIGTTELYGIFYNVIFTVCLL